MSAARPRLRSRGYQRRYHPEDQTGINPLYLFTNWLRQEPGFARPGPPRPPTQIRLACKGCRATATPTDNKCHECGERF
ncbi:hypothetical protein DMP23_05775 [Amycolatopsis sp. A1MSW2902]